MLDEAVTLQRECHAPMSVGYLTMITPMGDNLPKRLARYILVVRGSLADDGTGLIIRHIRNVVGSNPTPAIYCSVV